MTVHDFDQQLGALVQDRRKGKAAKEEQKPRPASPHSKAKEKGKLSTKDNPLPVNWDTSGKGYYCHKSNSQAARFCGL